MNKFDQKIKIIKNSLEQEAWKNDICLAGIDEAGRGPLCGPVVVAGAILPHNNAPDFLVDSKTIPEKKRNAAFEWVTQNCIYTLVIVNHHEIDEYNIYRATMNGMRQVYFQLADLCRLAHKSAPQHLVIDAMPLPPPQEHVQIFAMPRAESASSSVAAASIVAKVMRDRLMQSYDNIFNGYGFAQHKGYGTSLHAQKIRECGPSLIHRKLFIRNIMNSQSDTPKVTP